MAQSVDPQRVIQKLAMHIANEIVQNAIKEVALEDAEAVITEQEKRLAPHVAVPKSEG